MAVIISYLWYVADGDISMQSIALMASKVPRIREPTVIYFLSAAVIVPFPQEIYVADYPIRISVFIGSSVLNQSFLGS